jgi:molybdopterin guanine dinucleotide-containing S/N-oxide reductase-like protein
MSKPEERYLEPAFEPERTVTKTLNLGGRQGLPMRVDVKNGRIIRIRPLHFDEKYSLEHIQPWKIEARGKAFRSHMKSLPYAFQTGYKRRVYSPNRILYPLKRVDFDPDGERNPQNRGKSKFKRISWDEATDIIAGEIRRIHREYGPFAILCQGDEIGHGESKNVHRTHGCQKWLLLKMGGYTDQVRNADSAEGFYWGSKHVWGDMKEGQQLPVTNCLKDICDHTEMILYWGTDFETTPREKDPVIFTHWFKELGIHRVFVTPDLNYAAAVHADKWIPIIPNTDAALLLAIAHHWITEGNYEKEYVQTHCFGFDKFCDYVLGKEDGVPKTPEWASPICGIPEWTIHALADQWGSKITSIVQFGGGGMIRGPYSSEPARLEILCMAMQGIGMPGRHEVWPTDGVPLPSVSPDCSSAAPFRRLPWMKQLISKVYIHKAILEPPISHWGKSRFFLPVEDQFIKYTYPIPREEGGTRIHMLWNDHPSWIGNWNHGNLMIKAWRDPSIEFVVAQHPWMEHDCLFADVILPINTVFEEEDIMTTGLSGGAYATVFHSEQAIPPIGESKSDYEAVGEVAKKLGMYEQYSGGKTIEEKIQHAYENSGVAGMVSWEELNEKGYFVIPPRPDWEQAPAGMYDWYKDPEANPVHTKSGKIEFYAQWLAEHFPDDRERPPVPHWVPGGPGWTHDESLLGERAKKYPLLVISNHPHWRNHVQCDDISWLREIPTCKIKGPDGYLYEPVWMHPTEAARRGIRYQDLVKLYNERGAVLGAAFITERVIPGAIMQDHGARTDEIISFGLDRGGNHNLIGPDRIHSQNCTGQATNNFLVEVEKVDPAEMDAWRRDYPEAFARDYDPATGLHFDAWIINEKEDGKK